LVTRHPGSQPPAASYFQVDAANVLIETVKQAEDSSDIVLRLYESQGMSARTRLRVALPIFRLQETDLMEENARDLAIDGDGVDLRLDPFEIRTLQLTTG
jgi:alpha-mannosidase